MHALRRESSRISRVLSVMVFQLGEGLFGGIQIRRTGRQVQKDCACLGAQLYRSRSDWWKDVLSFTSIRTWAVAIYLAPLQVGLEEVLKTSRCPSRTLYTRADKMPCWVNDFSVFLVGFGMMPT
jgi:hypothetical protein